MKKIKFSWFPEASAKNLAKRGGAIALVSVVLEKIFSGALMRALFDISATYGVLLLIVSFFYWIREKRTQIKHGKDI
jgi:hypothetical protein